MTRAWKNKENQIHFPLFCVTSCPVATSMAVNTVPDALWKDTVIDLRPSAWTCCAELSDLPLSDLLVSRIFLFWVSNTDDGSCRRTNRFESHKKVNLHKEVRIKWRTELVHDLLVGHLALFGSLSVGGLRRDLAVRRRHGGREGVDDRRSSVYLK